MLINFSNRVRNRITKSSIKLMTPIEAKKTGSGKEVVKFVETKIPAYGGASPAAIVFTDSRVTACPFCVLKYILGATIICDEVNNIYKFERYTIVYLNTVLHMYNIIQ